MLFFHCGKTFASWPFLKFHISGQGATKCSSSEFVDLTSVTSFFPLYFGNVCFWQKEALQSGCPKYALLIGLILKSLKI